MLLPTIHTATQLRAMPILNLVLQSMVLERRRMEDGIEEEIHKCKNLSQEACSREDIFKDAVADSISPVKIVFSQITETGTQRIIICYSNQIKLLGRHCLLFTVPFNFITQTSL